MSLVLYVSLGKMLKFSYMATFKKSSTTYMHLNKLNQKSTVQKLMFILTLCGKTNTRISASLAASTKSGIATY